MAMARDSDWWSRLDAAFQGAVELPPAERAAYLDRTCGADAALRAEVDDMLRAESAHDAPEIEPLVRPRDPRPPEPDPIIGMRLGPWRVLHPIGYGGMGTVYLAERADGQYDQRVALKLVRGSAQQPGAAARFGAETYILARLSHPHIARLLDAGFTPEGSAYLVMEHVEGSPITTYCDEHRLTVRERLRLFGAVARATQHAHRSLVVHRDLKPLNIFVSAGGDVKLLDFGIAKLLEPDHPLASETTQGVRALTPAYAAPEQIRGEPVTTAADVYVLGAVLYELLTGDRPARNGSVNHSAAGDAFVPAPPSQAIRRRLASKDSGDEGAVAKAAAARGTTPGRLARQLEGDIDRVVLKALQPEPERRYGSAEQFGDDIDRLLEGRPVLAQPDTLIYRARRFAGRHRIGVVMTVALCVIALSFAIIAALQARAVAIERDRAKLEATRAARVTELLGELFKLAEPGAATGQSISARQLLDEGRARIASELAGDPPMQAALFNVVGRLYSNLALHDTAIEIFRQALSLERQDRPEGSLTQAETMHWLAELYVRKNDYASAERLLRDALMLRQSLGAPADDVASTLEALGRALSFTGRHAEAEVPLQQAVVIRRQEKTSPGKLMSSLNELAVTLHRRGDMKTSEALFREAVEVGRNIAGSSPDKVTSLLNLARLVYQFDRDAPRAEALYRETLAMARAIYPEDHEDIGTILTELARVVRDEGRLEEAEAMSRESMGIFTRLFGLRHRETMISSQTLASILGARGALDEAERLLREALTTAQLLFKDGRPMTLGAQRLLAGVLDERRKFVEARMLRHEELAAALKAFGPVDVYVALALAGLGQHGLASGDLELAESSFRRALDVRQRLHADNWRTAEARGMLGAVRLRAGRLAEAEPDLVAAYEGLRARRGPAARETDDARRRLVELYEAWQRPPLAQQYRAAAVPRTAAPGAHTNR
jgi:serine/threonine-protein kinase